MKPLMRKTIERKKFAKLEKKRVLFALNKGDFVYFRKHLNENHLDFSLMINELLALVVPQLKKGVNKFEFTLNLSENEDSKP